MKPSTRSPAQPQVSRRCSQPVVTHELETVTVICNGVQSTISAAEMRQQVEEASRKAAVWSPEDIGVQYEDDVLWGSWAAADRERSYRSAYADDNAWPKSITRDLWDALVAVWGPVVWKVGSQIVKVSPASARR